MGAIHTKYNKMPIVRLDKDIKLTPELITQLLNNAQAQELRYDSLEDYYVGKHDITYRTFSDTSKPNNKMVNNFASYIVDVKSGYFTGIPIVYNSKNQQYLDDVKEIMDRNNADDTTNELDKITNIYGHGFELFWIDETGNLRFKQVKPEEVVMVYTADVSEEPLYAIRHYKEQNIFNESVYDEYIFVYDKQYVYEYKYVQDDGQDRRVLMPATVYPHMFNNVPVIEYLNNEQRLSSFEDVISLIDAYNVAESDSVNEVQYFNDAYLKLRNLSATDDDDLQDMKNNRVILVEGDGDAEWLTKQINDTYLEHLKERIAKDIHKFSKTPNLVSDEFVSNLSGTAIRYKVWGLEQDTASKERKWRKAIKKRLEFITYILNAKGADYNVDEIEITFNRNLPQNVMELGQMASQLTGIVSQETLLEQIPFVENVQLELQKVEKEQEKKLENFGGMFENANAGNANSNTGTSIGQEE